VNKRKCKCGWPKHSCMRYSGYSGREAEAACSSNFGGGNFCDPNNAKRCGFVRWYPLQVKKELGVIAANKVRQTFKEMERAV